MENRKLTIREVADALGLSMATIRRRIKAGELKAELQEGPYGETYFIWESDLKENMATFNLIPVKKELDLADLEELFSPFFQEIHSQRQIIEQQNTKIEKLMNQSEERDRLLLEAIRGIQEQKKPWWRKIIKG